MTRLPSGLLQVATTIVISLFAFGCGRAGSTATAQTVELTVLAASSLQGPLERLRDAYATVAPAVRLRVSTDSSAALRTQIEQGAQADVFLSADEANVAALGARALTAGPGVPFAANRMALIVPRDNPANIRSPADLARAGVRIIAAGDAVPVTTYALEVVTRLGRLDKYPPGFAASYDANVVSREANVRSVVTRVQLGEGDAAIVYATDAAAAGNEVREIPVADGAQVTAVHAAAVLAASESPDAATAFVAWLRGPEARGILSELGFLAPP